MAKDGPVVVLDGESIIDTANGTVFNGGTSIDVPFEQFNGMSVFMFKELTINSTLTAEKGETPALVLLVDGDVTINGVLDISADSYEHGPGALIDDACGGVTFATATTVSGGGSGGGNVHPGGKGGAPGDGAAAVNGGVNDTNPSLDPLHGGCPGGWASESTTMAVGGGGGGAVQIVSRTKISLLGSDGAIDASGGGGGSTATTGGAGGGSGGAVLLEAPQVILDGAVVISTKGGGGAAATTTGAAAQGADGDLSAGTTPGGTSASYPDGGAGGTRNTAPGVGQSGTTASMDGAGGGGSVGKAYFRTESGYINPQGGAAIYSNYATTTIGTRLVPP